MMTEFLCPIQVDAASLALDAIQEIGPGGHFFNSPHTMERYQTAFYSLLLSDWRNYESWAAAGSLGADRRANTLWRQLLQDYEQPPLDPAVEEALVAFVARRKQEIHNN